MDLTKDPLPGLLRQIAVPAATGLFLQTLLNLTNAWFAGRISTLAQAALGLSFPLFFVLFTFSAGLSTGASALVGRALGAGDVNLASRLAGQSLLTAAVMGFVLAAAGAAITRPAFISMGAEGAYLELCLDYMNTIFYAAPFFLLLSIANAFLTAQGDSRSMRNALAVAVVANFFMSRWFIEGGLGLPPLGVRGLALSTILVQVGALAFLWIRVMKTCLFRKGLKSALKPDFGLQKELARQVLPPAVNQASVGLGIYIVNWFVGHFGADTVAAYGVGVRIEQLILLPALGISMAVLPLTAQNDGAGQFERVINLRSMAVCWGAAISLLGISVLIFGGHFLMGLISPDEAVRAKGAWYLKIDAAAFFAYVLLYINVSFLQGLKRPMFAVWMGLYRQIVAPLAVIWLLAFTLGLEATGIWLGFALVTISGAVIAEVYTRKVIRERRPADGNFHSSQ